ncbi:MAG: energy-coupling factor transporter transmembrane protein EcfT [Ruminococcus sp.]|uniref:energy-coupling factor transporter transmembrane component T n=1 Tax=Mediterraneibacter faecis TaxID=592978 RepID=UPI003CEAEA80|nr:energy-coupling factor transporter transmembrane protein EcfT [Ruminococcus sp.]
MESKIKQKIMEQPFRGTALLDPRCKGLLLILLGFVSYFVNGEAVSLILVLGFALFVSLGNGAKWAAKMVVSYAVVSILSTLLKYVPIPVLSVMMSVFGVTILKFIPIVMVGNWILRTTHMDDLMVALQRMRLPQSVTIPLVVMFRYIPTLGIEYRMIRNTMDIRGISDTLWKRITRPVATVEYILIPLLMRCLKVTDELAASGTTRGLELEEKRYALRDVRFSLPEYLVCIAGLLFLGTLLFLDHTSIGEIVLWRV